VTPSTRLDRDLSEFDPYATPVPGSSGLSESADGKDGKMPRAQRERAKREKGSDGTGGTGGTGAGSSSTRPIVPSDPVSAAKGRDSPAPQTPTQQPGEGFNFSGFLRDLRLKSADPVARYLKR
jgi:hypothetical protein